jgi:hypothetical protein
MCAWHLNFIYVIYVTVKHVTDSDKHMFFFFFLFIVVVVVVVV